MEWAWAQVQLQFQEQVRMLYKIEKPVILDENIKTNNFLLISLRFSEYEILNCSTYHKINKVNVGCMFHYNEPQRFYLFTTWLYSDTGSLVTEQNHSLKEYGMKSYSYFLQLDNNCMAITGWWTDTLYCVAYQWSLTLRSTCLWWREKMLNCGCTGMSRIMAAVLRVKFVTGQITMTGR